jgi:hypothetical protein
MNYLNIYDKIIYRAKLENRKKNGHIYYEAHHILPVCLGGSGKCYQWKTHSNIVLLTAKEHFICHILLCEIYPNMAKLKYAIWMMCIRRNDGAKKNYIISSKLYEKLRISNSLIVSELHKNKIVSEETRQRIKNSNIGKSRNKKEKNPMWGKSLSKDTRDKISEAQKGNQSNLGKKHSLETKKKMSDTQLGDKNSFFGKKHSIDTINKIKCTKLKDTTLCKRIIQYSLEGSFIQNWQSIRAAARALNISASSISRVCSGRSLMYKGFIWKYDHLNSIDLIYCR